MTLTEFQNQIRAGIPERLPAPKAYDPAVNHAPRRKEILSAEERVLALRNALRYFPENLHAELAREFADELHRYGRIYMYRLRPDYAMHARPIDDWRSTPTNGLPTAATVPYSRPGRSTC